MPGEVILCMNELARTNPAGRHVQFGCRDSTKIEDHMEEADDMHNKDFVLDKHSVSSSSGSSL